LIGYSANVESLRLSPWTAPRVLNTFYNAQPFTDRFDELINIVL
jgi:hypothetical protein